MSLALQRDSFLGADLIQFYASHGFKVISDSYLEDGIPHVDMRKEAVAI